MSKRRQFGNCDLEESQFLEIPTNLFWRELITFYFFYLYCFPKIVMDFLK